MSIKVGINGFGRIGRLVFRAGISRSDIEFVGINDPFMTPDYMAYMLRYDTMHGQFDGTIEYTDDAIIVNGKTVKFFACMDPKDIPWGEVGAEYVVESTGMFLTKEKAQAHIDAGAKKVVMSAPSKDDTPMFVMGVNQDSSVSYTHLFSNQKQNGFTTCSAPNTFIAIRYMALAWIRSALHPSFHSLWIHQPDIPMKHSVQMPAHMPMTG